MNSGQPLAIFVCVSPQSDTRLRHLQFGKLGKVSFRKLELAAECGSQLFAKTGGTVLGEYFKTLAEKQRIVPLQRQFGRQFGKVGIRFVEAGDSLCIGSIAGKGASAPLVGGMDCAAEF